MNKTNLWVDIGIFAGFLITMNPALTGIPLHEWLSLALAAALIAHLLLHWKWMTTVALQFFRKLFHSSRLKFAVDILLFTAFIALMLSGMLISRSIVNVFGFQLAGNPTWRFVHSASANISLLLVGLHFALNWNCVAIMFKRYILSPLSSLGWRRNRQPVPVPVEVTEN